MKACVDKTTLTNEEEGVAVAVERTILAEIRPTEVPLDQLNMRARHALMGNLGIQYTYASEDRVEATMPVDERTRQPSGILHGGATLALAETVAGLGSMILAKPDEIVVGMQVSGNHMSSAHEGDTVRAVGTIIHKGRSSHVWNVDVFTSTDKWYIHPCSQQHIKKEMTPDELRICNVVDTLIRKNRSFALWRIPGESPRFAMQASGSARILYHIEELDEQSGFVIAPFHVSKQHQSY